MALTVEVYDRADNSFGDISTYCLSKSVTRRLNRPASGRFRIPSKLVPWLETGACTARFRVDGNIVLNGIVWFIDDDGDENTMYTDVLVMDPMVWWKKRIAMDADGDFSLPTFLTDLIYGPLIIQEIVRNSVETLGADGEADGPLGLDYSSGTYESGGQDMSGAPIDWPASLGDMATLLTDTGALDIVIDPVEGFGDGIMGVLNAYNQYGNNLSGSVVFDYATGEHNVRRMRRSEDMESIGNALRYFFTPKESIQRYRGNITRDDGGRLPGEEHEDDPPEAESPEADFELQNLIADSRARLGKFVDHRYYDVSTDWHLRDIKPLYWLLWKLESRLRVKPRELIYATPIRGLRPTFDIGDIITVQAGADFRGGFSSSQQRVYEYTMTEEADGVFELSELVTSADQESEG